LEWSEFIPNYPWTTLDRLNSLSLYKKLLFPVLVPSVLSCNGHAPVVSATPGKVSHRCTWGHFLVKGSLRFLSSVSFRFNPFLRVPKNNWRGRGRMLYTSKPKKILVITLSFPFPLKDLDLQRLSIFNTLVQG
jgi:hypothetical protein